MGVPAPLPPVVRLLISASRYASWSHLTWITFNPTEDPVMAMYTGDYELRKLTVKWQRVIATTPTQDLAMATFHFINITNGEPDSTWTTGDYTSVENAMDTMWTSIKPNFAAPVVLSEYQWRADGPLYRPHTPKPDGLLAPTLRVVSKNVAGTAAGEELPPQVALSVTEVTPAKYTAQDVEGVGDQVRNRWGRFYLPNPGVTKTASGRPDQTMAEAVASAVQTFYNACVTAELVPVMYSPTTGNAWSVTEVHVDDIWDVIRSRRFVTPTNRHVKTINQL